MWDPITQPLYAAWRNDGNVLMYKQLSIFLSSLPKGPQMVYFSRLQMWWCSSLWGLVNYCMTVDSIRGTACAPSYCPRLSPYPLTSEWRNRACLLPVIVMIWCHGINTVTTHSSAWCTEVDHTRVMSKREIFITLVQLLDEHDETRGWL